MSFSTFIKGFALALALGIGLSQPAAGQSISSTDIQRLQDGLSDAARDVSQARTRDQSLGSQLQTELDQLRDEATYLKVKVQKNEPTVRTDYFALRDKIDDLRSRARAESASRSAPAANSTSDGDRNRTSGARSSSGSGTEVPVGTEFDVRLQQPLNSSAAQVEDRFEATTMVDLRQGDRVMVPAGSLMRGIVSSVNKAGRVERKGSLTVAFDQVTINGRAHPIRATVTQALESEGIRGETGKIGAGAGVGAVIGGILGGFKGALAGILIGGGGTIAATEGKDVALPVGTVLRVRLDAPLNLR